jgi:hypothetical protein
MDVHNVDLIKEQLKSEHHKVIPASSFFVSILFTGMGMLRFS